MLVRPGFWTHDLPHGSPMLNQLSQPVGGNLPFKCTHVYFLTSLNFVRWCLERKVEDLPCVLLLHSLHDIQHFWRYFVRLSFSHLGFIKANKKVDQLKQWSKRFTIRLQGLWLTKWCEFCYPITEHSKAILLTACLIVLGWFGYSVWE